MPPHRHRFGQSRPAGRRQPQQSARASIGSDAVFTRRRKETTMKTVTNLSLQGQCREAFEFYAKVWRKNHRGHTLWRCASGHADHR